MMMSSSDIIADLLEQAQNVIATLDKIAAKLADGGMNNQSKLPLLSPQDVEGGLAKPTVSHLPTASLCNHEIRESQFASLLSGNDTTLSAHQVFDSVSDPNSCLNIGISVKSVETDLVKTRATLSVSHPACHGHNTINNIESIVCISCDITPETKDGTSSLDARKVLDEIPLPEFIREMADAANITPDLNSIECWYKSPSDIIHKALDDSLTYERQWFTKPRVPHELSDENMSSKHQPFQVKTQHFTILPEIHSMNLVHNIVCSLLSNDLDWLMGSNLSNYLGVKAFNVMVFELEIDRKTFLSFKKLHSWGNVNVQSAWRRGLDDLMELPCVHSECCLFSTTLRDCIRAIPSSNQNVNETIMKVYFRSTHACGLDIEVINLLLSLTNKGYEVYYCPFVYDFGDYMNTHGIMELCYNLILADTSDFRGEDFERSTQKLSSVVILWSDFMYSQLSTSSLPNFIFDPDGEMIGMVPENFDDTCTCGCHVRMEAQTKVFDPGLILMDIVSLRPTHVCNKCRVISSDLGDIGLDADHNLRERLIREECTRESVDFFCFDPGGLWACDWDDDDGLLHELSLLSDISNFRFSVFVLSFLAGTVLSDMGIEVLIFIPTLEDKGDFRSEEGKIDEKYTREVYNTLAYRHKYVSGMRIDVLEDTSVILKVNSVRFQLLVSYLHGLVHSYLWLINYEGVSSLRLTYSLALCKTPCVVECDENQVLSLYASYTILVSMTVGSFIFDPGGDWLTLVSHNGLTEYKLLCLYAEPLCTSASNVSKVLLLASIIQLMKENLRVGIECFKRKVMVFIFDPGGNDYWQEIMHRLSAYQHGGHRFSEESYKNLQCYVFDPGGQFTRLVIDAMVTNPRLGRCYVMYWLKYHLSLILEDKDHFKRPVLIHIKS